MIYYSIVIKTLGDNCLPMHILQPKHTKLKPNEVKDLVEKYNIALSQLSKIKVADPACPDGCETASSFDHQ